MDHSHLSGFQFQVAGKVHVKEAQGLDALGEEHDALGGVVRVPLQKTAGLQNLYQALVLGEGAGANSRQSSGYAAQSDAVFFGVRSGLFFDLAEALANSLQAGGRRGEERFLQDRLEEKLPAAARFV